jgi:hypothetical protein
MSPIELPALPPRIREEKGQSHNYPNTTKSNPIILLLHSHHTTIVSTSKAGVGYSKEEGKEIGRQPLSNCFYGGAFPHCLARATPPKRHGQDVRGLSPKALFVGMRVLTSVRKL